MSGEFLTEIDRYDRRLDRLDAEKHEVLRERELLTERVRVLEEALRRVESVYDRTQPGPRDACRDQVLEITRKALSGGEG